MTENNEQNKDDGTKKTEQHETTNQMTEKWNKRKRCVLADRSSKGYI